VSTLVGGVALEHPVMNASGTCDPIAAAAAGVALHADLAAIVTKTVTPLAREGNEPPRLAEAPAGLLNSIGLANPGIEGFLAQALPQIAALGRPVVVSVGAFERGEYVDLVRALDGAGGIVALELNVSCPNVSSGCISIGTDAAETRDVVAACRGATRLPLWVKLPPGAPDIAGVARAAAQGGADALVLTNTLRGAAIDRRTGRPLLGGVTGGLSGPALRPVALACVLACRAATSLPIVGVGGITSGPEAWGYLAAGACAVQVGTALFGDPRAAGRIRDELDQLIPPPKLSTTG